MRKFMMMGIGILLTALPALADGAKPDGAKACADKIKEVADLYAPDKDGKSKTVAITPMIKQVREKINELIKDGGEEGSGKMPMRHNVDAKVERIQNKSLYTDAQKDLKSIIDDLYDIENTKDVKKKETYLASLREHINAYQNHTGFPIDAPNFSKMFKGENKDVNDFMLISCLFKPLSEAIIDEPKRITADKNELYAPRLASTAALTVGDKDAQDGK